MSDQDKTPSDGKVLEAFREISAIDAAQVAQTQTDVNPWAVAEDEERRHEDEDRIVDLKIQLKAELSQPKPITARPEDVKKTSGEC